MEGSSNVELRLEVDPATRPLTGKVMRPDRETVDFVGWTGLMGALDRLLRNEDEQEEES